MMGLSISFSDVCKLVISGRLLYDIKNDKVVDLSFTRKEYDEMCIRNSVLDNGMLMSFVDFKIRNYEVIKIENMRILNVKDWFYSIDGEVDLNRFNRIMNIIKDGKLFYDYEYDRIIDDGIAKFQYKVLFEKDFSENKKEYEKFLDDNFTVIKIENALKVYQIGYIDTYEFGKIIV